MESRGRGDFPVRTGRAIERARDGPAGRGATGEMDGTGTVRDGSPRCFPRLLPLRGCLTLLLLSPLRSSVRCSVSCVRVQSQKLAFVASCPTKVYSYNEHTRSVAIEDANRCMYCQECVKKAESFKVPTLVSIAPKPGRFIFTVEGTGALDVDQVVATAIDVLYRKLTLIEDQVNIEILKRDDGAAAQY